MATRWYKGNKRKNIIGKKRWRALKRAANEREGTRAFEPLIAQKEWGSYDNYKEWASNNPERDEMYFFFRDENEYNNFVNDDTNKNNLFSGISNLWNKWTGNSMTEADIQANQLSRDNALFEQQLALETWNQTQSYEARVQSMLNAGINPALMMGGASGAAPAQASSPAMPAPNVSSGDMGHPILGMVQALMQASSLKSENALRKSQSEKNIADADLARADAKKKGVETDILEIDKAWADTRNWLYTKEGLSRIDKNLSDIKVNDGRIELMGSEVKLNLADVQLKESQKLVNEADAILKGLEAEKARALLPYAVEYMRADILLKNATTKAQLASAESLHANALVNMAEAMIKRGLIQGGYIEKFLANLDADTLEKSNLAVLHIDQGDLAAAQADAAGAYKRQAEAQADYTETSQNFIVADKLIGYFSQFLAMSTGLLRDAGAFLSSLQ